MRFINQAATRRSCTSSQHGTGLWHTSNAQVHHPNRELPLSGHDLQGGRSGKRGIPSHPSPTARRDATRLSALSSGADVSSPRTPSAASVQAVLFAMDGLLMDSTEIVSSVGCAVLKELYGISATLDDFAAFEGSERDFVLQAVAERCGVQGFNQSVARTAYVERFTQVMASGEHHAKAGAVQLVRSCRAAGMRTAVVSTSAMAKVEAALRAAGMDPIADFDAIVIGSDAAGGRLKAGSDMLLLAAERLGVPAHQCVVVQGDVPGMAAASTAGIRVLGVSITRPLSVLQAQGVALAVTTLQDITPITLQALQQSQAPAPNPLLQAAAPNTAQGNPQTGLLQGIVPLPGGRRTTRRELLKLLPLAGGLGCVWVLGTRLKAFSFTSPQALLNELVAPPAPDMASMPSDMGGRMEAFKQFILDLEENRSGGKPVPDFGQGLDWLNSGPLSLSKKPLKGKVVLLDFWTYCCINCIHVLPELAALEARFAGAPVAVVGVHSAKFDNEKDSSAINAAVLRYDISHPVVNDANMSLWGALGVSSWPTIAVVSPRGRLLAMLSGEGHGQDLQDLVAAALEVYGARGELDDTPLQAALERDKQVGQVSPLRYPGKMAADIAGGRLFISDSNNHRIVVTDLQGNYIDQIGGNGPTLVDGSFAAAGLNRPQGLAYDTRTHMLYIADTENHAVRAANLGARIVVTLAGNGSKGDDFKGGGRGNAQALNSPWDLVLNASGTQLVVALAGQHQMWSIELSTGITSLLSGNGYERNQNGTSPLSTSWAQPSGLSLDPRVNGGAGRVWVADSESSSVRLLDLETGGSMAAAGGDPLFADNLFRFGDRDGIGSDALLQHPLALCAAADGSVVYIADSYNHRIKALDTRTNEVTTIAGCGKPGFQDGMGVSSALSEPGGLALGPNGTLLIADTNNCAIRMLDPATGKVTTLMLKGVPAPSVDPVKALAVTGSGSASLADTTTAAWPGLGAPPVPEGTAIVRSADAALLMSASGSAPVQVQVQISLPDGYHLTKGAPSSYYSQSFGPAATAVNLFPATGDLKETLGSVSFALKVQLAPSRSTTSSSNGDALARVFVKLYYCKQSDVCLYEQVCFEVPVTLLSEGGQGRALSLKHAVAAPQPSGALTFL